MFYIDNICTLLFINGNAYMRPTAFFYIDHDIQFVEISSSSIFLFGYYLPIAHAEIITATPLRGYAVLLDR
jgi:hypothetical protein